MKASTFAQNYQFVSFCIHQKWYCFDIRVVREVNQDIDIMEIPLSDTHIRGLVNIRGQVVLVLDINVLLGSSPLAIERNSQIIIFKTSAEISQIIQDDTRLCIETLGDKPVGFLVDDIGDIIFASREEIEPAPQHLSEHNAHCFDGVILQDDILYGILNMPTLLEKCANNQKDDIRCS